MKCMKACFGFSPLDPKGGGTFVTHHMVFQKRFVTEMLQQLHSKTRSNLPWPKLIMSMSRKFYRFSEYKSYCTFMLRYYPGEFNYHPFSQFGESGLRFRDATGIVNDMMVRATVTHGGISYSNTTNYVMTNLDFLSTATVSRHVCPAYIQLDHVYGLRVSLFDGLLVSSVVFGDRDHEQHKRMRLSVSDDDKLIGITNTTIPLTDISINDICITDGGSAELTICSNHVIEVN
jgi:hypothetical protein